MSGNSKKMENELRKYLRRYQGYGDASFERKSYISFTPRVTQADINHTQQPATKYHTDIYV